MSDSFFPLILLTVVTSALLIGLSNKLQQVNNQQRKTFNNDYIPPKSPLDIPVRTVPRHIPSSMHTSFIYCKDGICFNSAFAIPS